MAINREILDARYGYKDIIDEGRQEIINALGDNYNSYAQFIVEGGDTSAYNRKNPNIIRREINGVVKEKGVTREVFIYERTNNNISSTNNNAGAGEVWVVAHGWNPDLIPFLQIADLVKQAKPAAKVLLVDWMQASETQIKRPINVGPFSDNFKAVTWIGPIAELLSQTLTQNGITGSSLNFIGHSFGSFLSSTTANELGRVSTITALDPASALNTLGGYDLDLRRTGRQQPVNFRTVSNYSRAYVGSRSLSGNQRLASSAHESFQIDFGLGVPLSPQAKFLSVVVPLRRIMPLSDLSTTLRRVRYSSTLMATKQGLVRCKLQRYPIWQRLVLVTSLSSRNVINATTILLTD